MSSPGSSNGEREDSPSPDVKEEKVKTNDLQGSPKKDDKVKEEAKSPSTNKSAAKDEEKDEESEEEEEDSQDGVGLLDRPVEVSGSRARKKVQRLELSFTTPSKDKHEIPEGHGEKLGDCPRIEFQIQKTPIDELKVLHRILFGRAGSGNEIKKNIRKFCGFTFTKNSQEYDKKKAVIEKSTTTILKHVCEVLDLERSGTKDEIVGRVLDFLLKPKSSGKKVPKSKKKSSSKSAKRKSDKKEKPVKNASKKKTQSSDDSASSAEEEEEEEEEEDAKSEESESAEESDEPKKKKSKPSASKKKATPAKQKAAPKKTNKKNAKTKKAAESSDEDSSDDEPLVKMAKTAPTDEEIKALVKKILQSADLQEITMKKVIKQVFDEFPDFDLSDKKDYIKATVKSVIS